MNKSNTTSILFLLCALCGFTLPSFSAQANNRGNVYFGLFGGWGNSNNNNFSQVGTAFYPASKGGPLAVNARGPAEGNSEKIIGGQVGHQWAWLNFASIAPVQVAPIIEFEGYYLSSQQTGSLLNPTDRVPEHRFVVDLPMHNGVFLVNGLFNLQFPELGHLLPYVGGGLGTAEVSIYQADSLQTLPPEPHINHMNSNRNCTAWTFAAQVKGGLQYHFTPHLGIFAEYRYLYLSPSNYIFGSTQYPTHPPTTHWQVHFGSMNFNLAAVGLTWTV